MTARRSKIRIAIGMPAVFAVLFLLPAPGRGESIEQVTINHVEAAAAADRCANEVRAYITVSAAGQRPIGGLTLSDFEALEDGRPVAVAGLSRTTDPMAVVLVIDTSGSMQARDRSGQTSMDAARKAAADFIAMLSPADRVALFSFNRAPRLQADFGAEHAAVLSAVDGLAAVPNAYTCLYDSAFEAVKKAAEIPKGRRAVILLTDGRDEKGDGTCSTHHVGDVIDLATTRTIRVPIYTIGVGSKVDNRELNRIAHLTGGRSMAAASPEQLPGFYHTLAEQLKNQYLLTYRSQTASGEHSLVVKVRRPDSLGQDEKRFWAPPLPLIPPPAVSFAGIAPREGSADVLLVKIDAAPQETIAKIRFYIDGVLKQELASPPFESFDWNTAGLAAGTHVLRVEALDVKGQSGIAEVTQSIGAVPPPAAKKKVVPAEKPYGAAMALAALFALMLAGGGGGVWWFRRRRKDAAAFLQPDPPVEVPELREKKGRNEAEETIFFGGAACAGEGGDTVEAKLPAATLMVVESPELESGKAFHFAGAVSIGRGEENDIHIPEKAISRKHAEIYFDADRYYIRDLGSKYGTKVDGRDASSVRIALSADARIYLGPRTILKFEVAAVPEIDDNSVTKRNE